MTALEQIKGWAAFDPTSPLKPWSYIPRPLGPNDVEVKISHCGICYSDVHTYTSGWGPAHYPLIVGHEVVGTVTAIGSSVKHLHLGQRVGVGPQAYACMECPHCKNHYNQICPSRTLLYNDTYKDGRVVPEACEKISQGGYANSIRVQSEFALPIPDNLPSAEAAPLLCAGVTVFTPLRNLNIGLHSAVGVVGIGGLGHLAVQFAHKLGAQVTAISHSERKRADAEKLGATHFINVNNPEQLAAATHSLDAILVSSWGKDADWNILLSMLKDFGTIVLLAVPEQALTIPPAQIVMRFLAIQGSLIGSPMQTMDMLNFAAQHDVKPWIEVVPMKEVNIALDRLKKGDVKYRFVLANE